MLVGARENRKTFGIGDEKLGGESEAGNGLAEPAADDVLLG